MNVVTRDPRRQVFATDTDWTQSMGPAVGVDDDDDDTTTTVAYSCLTTVQENNSR